MNAPEKVYRDDLRGNYWLTPIGDGTGTEYIRADIREAEIDALKAENAELHMECDRLTSLLQWEQNRRDHIGTHGDDCWKWGPAHHECAMREIERLTAMLGPQMVLEAEEVTEPGFYLVRADNTNPWVPCVVARFNARSEGLRMLLAGKSEELPVIGELTPIKMTEVQG